MPREDRRIIFDFSEAYNALYGLCAQKDMRKPPPGAIKSCTVKPDDDQVFEIRIVNPLENTAATIEYTRDFIAAALMRSCRSSGIPLPKKALKSVDIGNDTFVLRVMI